MIYTQTGRILKVTGGLYTVRLDDHIPHSPLTGQTVECRARGNLRHEHTTPLVGDLVEVQYDHTSFTMGKEGALPSADRTGLVLDRVLPRVNCLIRPPLANLDTMLVVMAAAAPDPHIPTVDKLLSILEYNHIRPVIVVGKRELSPKRAAKLVALYERVGYAAFSLSCRTGEGVEAFSDFVHRELQGRIAAVAGASGAGKSTLLNTVFPGLELTTGCISERIGRGKNTTRHTELFPIPGTEGGYIADTAGFSLLDFERFDFFDLEELPHTFREFAPYLGQCRYTDCTHVEDLECAVLAAVERGEISPVRHASYRELYATLKAKRKYD